MKRLYVLFALVIAAVILVIGVTYSTVPAEAQGGTRQVDIKRVNMNSGEVTTEARGVVAGISCLEMGTGVECFIVSTR